MGGADKQDLRSELGQERRALTPEQIDRARAGVRSAVLTQAARSAWRCVAAYVPMRTEPGSVELLDALVAAGVRVLVPVVLADRDLDWTGWGEPAEVLGVSVLTQVDAVLVPALAVSLAGTRLGRGGGSYDRALTRVRPGTPIAALLYSDEVVHSLPSDEWDVPVNAIVTPEGWTELA